MTAILGRNLGRKIGKIGEVWFWRSWFATEGREWKQEYQSRLDPGLPLQDGVAKYLPVEPRRVRILDVGAGPLTSLGKVTDGHELDITAVDPLAASYDSLLRKYKIEPIVRTRFGEAEKLSKQFGSDVFDLVHVSNALDHSRDPMTGIIEMLKVVKPGCYVLLFHSRNEAEKKKYRGFHQWNFDSDGDFIIWDRKQRVNATHRIGELAAVTVGVTKGDWITVSLRKKDISTSSPTDASRS